jgi:hypothetical protein
MRVRLPLTKLQLGLSRRCEGIWLLASRLVSTICAGLAPNFYKGQGPGGMWRNSRHARKYATQRPSAEKKNPDWRHATARVVLTNCSCIGFDAEEHQSNVHRTCNDVEMCTR